MFNVPLPTDNLYKFVSLAGLALIVVGYFFYSRSQEDLNKEQETILWDMEDLRVGLAELRDFTVYFPGLKPLAVLGDFPNDDFDAHENSEYLQRISESARSYADQFEHPLTVQNKELYLTDLEVREAIMVRRHLSKAEYEKWIQSLSTLDIENVFIKPAKDVAQKVLNRARMLKLETLHYYALTARAREERRVANRFGGVGGILMVIGFTFWWWKVQRYQDKLLRKQAANEGT